MRVAMLYTWDWSAEFSAYAEGSVPAHRLFGAAELPAMGAQVVTCRWRFAPSRIRRRQLWKIWQALWVIPTQTKVDCVIATTESSALPVLLLRLIGVVRVPIVVLSVATLTEKYVHGFGGLVRRLLLRRADRVVVYASAQVPLMSDALGIRPERVRFIPFGVDTTFFEPIVADVEWDVLSVGTNEGKDFPTLCSALASGARCLIVTDQQNANRVRATSTAGRVHLEHDVPITELRSRYAAARCHVIPMRDVPYSSGQTVLLENLAMGRPVIASDTAAIRDYVSPEVVTLVPPGDVAAMTGALALSQPSFVAAAAEHVRERFSSGRFAADLADLCTETADESARR